MFAGLIQQLRAAQSLSPEQVGDAVVQLTAEEVTPESKAEFLSALAQKGETVEEISAFAAELRQRSVQPDLDAVTRAGVILDVCGTGGDRLNTFNISTTVSIVAAAGGVFVAKHGNRAITSQSGSADVLEALGVRIDHAPAAAAESLRKHHFAFFFAPKYHPAFKHIGPARKICAERGQRTIFNFLGPLLNPALPSAQLIGVPRPELCEPMARVLQRLGVRRGMVVCGAIGSKVQSPKSKVETPEAKVESAVFLDEFSAFGENWIAEFYQDRGFNLSSLLPDQFPVQRGTLNDLIGGDRQANAQIVQAILSGGERGPKRDAVLLNSAAALFVANKVRSMADGWNLAAEVIDSGAARQKLEALVAASRQ